MGPCRGQPRRRPPLARRLPRTDVRLRRLPALRDAGARGGAAATGLTATHAEALEADWDGLEPWDDAREFLGALAPKYRLGVVTNCSERLGRRAAAAIGVPFDVVVTSERAGIAKPPQAPAPFAERRTLRELLPFLQD